MSIKISGKSPGKSPGSKKKENGAWCNIDQDLLIPGKFLPVFNKNCQVSGRQQAIQQCIHNFSLGCGFCYMDQLNVKVQLIKQSERSDIPSSSRPDAVYINPQTMKLCNLVLAGPIVIQSGQKKSIGIAWPSESVSLDYIAIHPEMMNSMKLHMQEFLTVKLAASSVIYASEVGIKPLFNDDQDTFEENSLMRNTTKQYLDGKYLLPGNRFQVWLSGKSYQYEVTYIIGIHGHIQFQSETEKLEAVNKKMSELTISNDKDQRENSKDKLVTITENATRNYDPCSDFVYIVKNEQTLIQFIGIIDDTMNVMANKEITFDQIGGLKRQIRMINEIINFIPPAGRFDNNLGVMNGILLYGPSGVGKTLIAEAAANVSNRAVFRIRGPEIFSRLYGESEAKLKRIFDSAILKAPSVIIVDELDTLCPKRSHTVNEVEKRIVATFASLLDQISKSTGSQRVLVIACTNRIDAIDTALRRPGRFDREIEIGIPSADDRKEILKKILSNVDNMIPEENLTSIADSTHGFVGADLLSLCKEAAIQSVKRNPECGYDDYKSEVEISLQHSDLLAALNKVKPSAMREVAIEVPKVMWTDIGGQQQIKQRLKESVEWPIKHPSAFKDLGVKPPKGILLYGPPGCSKTLIAKALATESGLNFLAVKGPELFNKWVGESERAVRDLFRKARAASPSIIFFDEIDALAAQRGSDGVGVGDRVLTQLLTELDGIEQLDDVTIVAATNRPEMIDKALLRPGRIDRILYVPLPDPETRREILEIQFRKIPIDNDVDIAYLTLKTEGFSGAEVTLLCQEAAVAALQDDINCQKVCRQHFIKALSAIVPRTSKDSIERYKSYYAQSGLYMI